VAFFCVVHLQDGWSFSPIGISPNDNALWWQFAFQAAAPPQPARLAARRHHWPATAMAAVAGPARAAVCLRRKKRSGIRGPVIEKGEEHLLRILLLLGDKNLLFITTRTAMHHFQSSATVVVRWAITIGPRPRRKPWPGSFLRICDCMAVSPLFYHVTPERRPLYIDLGLTLSKLGEEARVRSKPFRWQARRGLIAPGAPPCGRDGQL